MARRRLIWRLFPTYLVFIVLCSAAIGLYAWEAFHSLYLAQTADSLQAQARMIRQQVADPVDLSRQKELEKLCQDVGRVSGSRVTIILPSGQVLADSRRDPESMDNHADRPEVKEALAGREGRSSRYSHTLETDMMYAAAPLRRDKQVVAVVRTALPVTAIQQATVRFYGRIALGAMVVAAIAALIALWVSRLLSRPLQEIRAGAARFARGELDHRLYVPNTEEIAGLAEALNEMARQLDEKIRTITEQNSHREAMLSSMIEGVVAVDMEQGVLSLNQAAAGLLDIAPAASGRRLRELIRNVELDRLVGEVLSGGPATEAEIVLGKEGQDRNVRVRAAPLCNDRGGGLGALLVLNDVTQLRRLERVRRDFVANVSHELKTPITSIKGFVETLRDGAVNDPQRARQFLDIVAAQADRLNAIIEDLLSLSRIEQEADRRLVKLAPARLAPVLQGAIALCQASAQARGVAVELDCPADLSATINDSLLEQAVVNLIDNAIKYSEPGRPVRVEASAADGGADIRVRDLGCGIPPEHLPRLFERFYRVDKARSRKLGGTGLGLAIVKHIVAAHGGQALVDSAPGKGSTFTIRLPGR